MATLDTDLTIGNCRPFLQKWTDPAAAKAGNFNPTDAPNFIPAMNRASRRLNSMGLWKGTTWEIWINGSTTGYITLPRRALALQGGNVNNTCPQEVFTTMNQYKVLGLGWRQPSQYTQPGFTDMQDGWCCQFDIDPTNLGTVGNLKLVTTNVADDGKKVWIEGTDVNGNIIYDATGGPGTGSEGITLTTNFASPPVTSQQFNGLNAINADVMLYPWSLYAVIAPSPALPLLLSSYEPGEQIPKYRRYKTGITQTVMQLFCKRRVIPYQFETDPVLPGSLDAFDYALHAMQLDDRGGDKDGTQYWGHAETVLNDDIRSARGRQSLTFPYKTALPPSAPLWVR